jgi:carnitine-CoA ligase
MAFLLDRDKIVLRHIVERHARLQPDRECFVFDDGETWDYEEVRKIGCLAAEAIAEFGIERGENVLVFLPNGKDWIRTLLGMTFLGAVLVPVNTAYKGEMLRHICTDSGARFIITDPGLSGRIKELSLDLVIIDPSVLSQRQEVGSVPPDQPIEPWDTFAIIYTSGTTGPSKGVITPYCFGSVRGSSYSMAGKEDTVLVNLPLFHTLALDQTYGFLMAGGRIVLQEGFSASRFWEIVRQYGITWVSMVQTMALFLLSKPPRPDDSDNPLKYAVIAPMVEDPDSFMARFGIQGLYSWYGATEISLVFSQGPRIIDPKSCGKPRSLFEVRLVDDHDIPVAQGEVGELILRSNLPWHLNAGYWRRPEETAQAWRNGWFHTGDMFFCDPEGNYFFADRKKDAIRRRGENISSFEVEREVLTHPDVVEAACVGVPGEFGEEEVKVFIIPHEGIVFDPVNLIEFLIPKIPYFMVPRYVEVVTEFPKTPSMRIQKYQLRARGNSPVTWDREDAGIVIRREKNK